jgi:hypothetical protein
MMTPEVLATEWMELFNTNIKKAISNKTFMTKYAELNQRYKELPIVEKSTFTDLIHTQIKRSLRP